MRRSSSLRCATWWILWTRRIGFFIGWGTEEDREELLKQKEKKASRAQPEQFVDFAAGVLSTYFSAVKATNSTAWDEAETKIRSTTAINGYVIALRRSLKVTVSLTSQGTRSSSAP